MPSTAPAKAVSRPAAGRLSLCLLLAWSCQPMPAPAPLAPVAAPSTAEAESPAASGQTYRAVLKWTTASESENFGFDVYRGESEDGPFTRVTEKPIPGAGTTDEFSHYQFIDRGIDSDKDYYYYVEAISMEGVREQFTPINKVRAQPVEEEDEAEGQAGQQGR